MKITIEIDVKNRYDEERVKRIVSCDDAFSTIYDISIMCRDALKHGDRKNDHKVIDNIMSRINESNLMDLYN